MPKKRPRSNEASKAMGRQIAAFRAERDGMTRPELALRSGVSDRTIENYETGRFNRDIPWGDLMRIAEALGTTLAEMECRARTDRPDSFQFVKLADGERVTVEELKHLGTGAAE